MAAGTAIQFFNSENLREWEYSGAFGDGWGATSGVWETPDLFELPVDTGAKRRWVLTVGVGEGAPAGGSGTQYFVGHFDGKTFTSENPKELVLWADYGADFYAAQSWNNSPDSRRLWLGWLNNWRYADQIPTTSWRGALSLPRVISLTETSDGIRLRQRPADELRELRNKGQSWRSIKLADGEQFRPVSQGDLLEIIVDIYFNKDVDQLGIKLAYGSGQIVKIVYSPCRNILSFDRTLSGKVDFDDTFAGIHAAPLNRSANPLQMHLLIDRAAIELFAAEGTVSFAEQVFPNGQDVQLTFFVEGGVSEIRKLAIFPLKPADFVQLVEGPF